mmetsp:Transcript_5360/g.16226  ORF Transcript_5360/g.16226 Transcript_5360/m.16226 type:complete len:237 (+) Transcript_5360:318-1028(+)
MGTLSSFCTCRYEGARCNTSGVCHGLRRGSSCPHSIGELRRRIPARPHVHHGVWWTPKRQGPCTSLPDAHGRAAVHWGGQRSTSARRSGAAASRADKRGWLVGEKVPRVTVACAPLPASHAFPRGCERHTPAHGTFKLSIKRLPRRGTARRGALAHAARRGAALRCAACSLSFTPRHHARVRLVRQRRTRARRVPRATRAMVSWPDARRILRSSTAPLEGAGERAGKSGATHLSRR